MRIERDSVADRRAQFLAVQIEGLDEQLCRGVLQHPAGILGIACAGEHQRKSSASEIRRTFRVGVDLLDPRRNFFEQPITHIAPQRVIDRPELLHVEYHDGQGAAVERVETHELSQALTEQRPFRQPRQTVEIGKKMDGFVPLEILKGKGQIGGQLQQDVQFRRIEYAVLLAEQRDDADDGAVDEQRQRGRRLIIVGDQNPVL